MRSTGMLVFIALSAGILGAGDPPQTRQAQKRAEPKQRRPDLKAIPAGARPARTDLKPFAYVEAKVPFYAPGGTRPGPRGADGWNKMQLPLTPAESIKHLVVPEGFEVQLFAAEPDIARPVALAWDERGRLWIAETFDYPNELQPPGKGRDRIVILEDTKGTGRADKFTVFADKLSIPTSLAFANGGLIVHQAPDTLFLKSSKGDDRADVRKVLLHGWRTNDTHAGPSNLRWGLDNWLWGIVGYAGFKGTVGDEKHAFSQGFYRFKPDGSKLEFLRNTSNNSWGVGFSEEGTLFGSTANGNPSVYLPIPNRYYESVRGWSGAVLGTIADTNAISPITEKVRQVDWHGRYTAAAGHALYTARAFPREYWNRAAFVNEPTGHLTGMFQIDPRGSDFVAKNVGSFLASDDEWTAPIVAEVGPDGALWVIDWYNYIVQHNPTPHGFKTGKHGAYETPLRDKKHGRIYRIVWKGAKANLPLRLDPTNAAQLVATLRNDNLFWRTTAQRLLVERGKQDVLPKLIQLAQDRTLDGIGLNPAAIHALWTMHGLGALDGSNDKVTAAAMTALEHPSAGVRRAAVQVLPRLPEAVGALLRSGALRDRDAQVRLAGLLALAETPRAEPAGKAILAVLNEPDNVQDRWLPDAATAAAAAHDLPFLRALAARKFDRPAGGKLLQVAARVAEHYGRGHPADSIGLLMVVLTGAEKSVAGAVVEGLAKGWPKNVKLRLEEASAKSLVRLMTMLPPGAKASLASLARSWGSTAFEKYAAELAAALLASVRSAQASDEARIAAAVQLIDLRKTDAAAVRSVLGTITPRTAPGLATGLLGAVGRSEAPEVGTALVKALPALTPAVRGGALAALLRRTEWTQALLSGVEQDKIQLAELSPEQRQALTSHPNKTIAAAARKLLARGGALPDADRQKVIDELEPRVLRGGNAAKGKLIFAQACAKCHTYGSEGAKIGPDLTGMWVRPKRELLIDILDPSRSVEGNYRQYSLVTTDGRALVGLLAAEGKTAIQILDAEGKTHAVQREDIDQLVASRKSLMPDGIEKQVPPEGLADLLEFLTQRGRYLPLDLRKAATIVSTQGMFTNKENRAERLVFPDWKPKTFAGVPFQLVDPKNGTVPNVILLYGPNGSSAPHMPKSVSLPCNAPAKAIHFLSGVSGWGYNGRADFKPTVSLIVRLHYADGKTEDHPLRDGVHFADYIRRVDVPESKFAFDLDGRQIRYLAIRPKRSDTIASIELVKGPDRTAPVVMAVTLESP